MSQNWFGDRIGETLGHGTLGSTTVESVDK